MAASSRSPFSASEQNSAWPKAPADHLKLPKAYEKAPRPEMFLA
ncbi:uncharacterized protein SOCEGT47_045790 [Sorangium cellulosum]|uniref:YTH domain-containing protein n=1 Tax=Sorangium cellulosum TaxID=56 RepID=A0A4P2Q4T0_SORCE|nr:uncharacterized protein SOCEGT47_045790 [Sorangium cellulosum]